LSWFGKGQKIVNISIYGAMYMPDQDIFWFFVETFPRYCYWLAMRIPMAIFR